MSDYIEATPGFEEALAKAYQEDADEWASKDSADARKLGVIVEHLVRSAGGSVRIPIKAFVSSFDGKFSQRVDGEHLVITTE